MKENVLMKDYSEIIKDITNSIQYEKEMIEKASNIISNAINSTIAYKNEMQEKLDLLKQDMISPFLEINPNIVSTINSLLLTVENTLTSLINTCNEILAIDNSNRNTHIYNQAIVVEKLRNVLVDLNANLISIRTNPDIDLNNIS